MNNPQQPATPGNVRPLQTQREHESPENRGRVIRVPRSVAFLALALLLTGVPLLCILLIANLSETSLLYFFGGLLSFSAGITTISFIVVMLKARAVKHWVRTAATVIESEAVWGFTSHGGRTAWTWLPRFTYQYEIGGQIYRGHRITFFRRCTGSCAQELVARHPPGSLVQVYYDPARPTEAVLERSFPGLWSLPFFTALLVVLAVLFFKLPSLLAW